MATLDTVSRAMAWSHSVLLSDRLKELKSIQLELSIDATPTMPSGVEPSRTALAEKLYPLPLTMRLDAVSTWRTTSFSLIT